MFLLKQTSRVWLSRGGPIRCLSQSRLAFGGGDKPKDNRPNMGTLLRPVHPQNVTLHGLLQHGVRMMSSTKMLIEHGCGNITMVAPKTRNSLSLAMIQELQSHITQMGNISEVRCIVIRGEGPAFSAGHNLKEMTTAEGREYHQLIFQRCNELMLEIVKSPVPIIAAVDGVAAAAGCQLVAMCDIAVATEKSSFSTPGSSVGLFCSTPGIPLARAVPRKVSSFMLLTGLPITASEALRAGLISKMVTDSDKLDKEVKQIVEAIRQKPRAVVTLGKQFYYRQLELGLGAALEEGGRVMVDNLAYKDAQEGIRAFKEKDKPVWTHTDDKAH